jgi:8-oxo-dGTP pyrophosphatase MutT (NUDIX family)
VVGLVVRYSHDSAGDLDFLLTYRSEELKHHPSEVCLPGGRVEDEAGESHATALDRELFEEVGIPMGLVEWEPRAWDSLVSLHGFQVFPYLGFLERQKCPSEFRLQEDEVCDAAWLSLERLFDKANWSVETRSVKMPVWKGWKHKTWGLTAAFLALFERRISGCTPY